MDQEECVRLHSMHLYCTSASRYRSMKYSWQNRHAPFLLPSIVEALMINSISGRPLQTSDEEPFVSGPTSIMRGRNEEQRDREMGTEIRKEEDSGVGIRE